MEIKFNIIELIRFLSLLKERNMPMYLRLSELSIDVTILVFSFSGKEER